MVNQIRSNPDNLHGFKIRIYPDEEQKARIKEISDLYRFVFNKTVAIMVSHYLNISEEEYNELHKQGKSNREIYFMYKDRPKNRNYSFIDLCKIIQDFRNTHNWMKPIPINIARYAIRNVFDGYKKFFGKVVATSPYIKKKKKEQTFACRGERVYFRNGKVKIEGILTMIDVKSVKIPQNEPLYSCTITYDGFDSYWLTFQTEMHYPIKFYPKEGPIGIDLGMRKLATLSDGTIYKPLDTKRLVKRCRKLESRVAKDRNFRLKQSKQAKTKLEDVPMSKRMQKRYIKYRKMVNHIWNKRKTYIHQITREIINRRPSAIVIENFEVEKLKRQRSGQHWNIQPFLFGEFRRQIEYKARWEGIPLIVAPTYYPSTQICSGCGHRHKQGKSEIYECPNCGLVIDRDINAALNLRSLAT